MVYSLLAVDPDPEKPLILRPFDVDADFMPPTKEQIFVNQRHIVRLLLNSIAQPQYTRAADFKRPDRLRPVVQKLTMNTSRGINVGIVFRKEDLPQIPLFLCQSSFRHWSCDNFGSFQFSFAVVADPFDSAIAGPDFESLDLFTLAGSCRVFNLLVSPFCGAEKACRIAGLTKTGLERQAEHGHTKG
jgi:hypothetical protein